MIIKFFRYLSGFLTFPSLPVITVIIQSEGKHTNTTVENLSPPPQNAYLPRFWLMAKAKSYASAIYCPALEAIPSGPSQK